MEEERFIDILKRVGGCVWFLFAGLMVAGLFIIIVGAIIYSANQGTSTGTMAIVCMVTGAICILFFFGICIVLPYVQWKRGITAESVRVWQSGILTDKVIKKDIRALSKTKVIGWFVATGVISLLALLVIRLSDEKNIGVWVMAGALLVTLFLAFKELLCTGRELDYRIEEDRVIGTEIKTTYDIVDAITNHLPTKTPMLYFERHGEYPIDSMHIHSYYMPEDIMSSFEKGEEVFVIYSNRSNRILHIYRKKYWTVLA